MQKKQRVLILGATGFIGRNLAEKFCDDPRFEVVLGYNVKPKYKINNGRWIRADLTHYNEVHQIIKNIDILIQSAAATSGSKDIINSPEIHVTDNAIMNSLILREAYRNNLKHIIFFSCTTMYRSDPINKQSEESFSEYSHIYPKYFGLASTKIYIEKLCEFYSSLSETKFTVIRHSNIYGPWDKFDLARSHVMGATITKILTAKKDIVIWGNGTEIRDFLFVDDLVDLVVKALFEQKDKFLLINAGSDTGISIAELTELVAGIAGKKLNLKFDKTKPTLNFSFISDSAKVKKTLGWHAITPLHEGVEKSLDWWQKNSRV